MKTLLHILISIVCLLVIVPGFCLSKDRDNTDSLIQVLQTAKEDSNKAKTLVKLSTDLLMSQPDKSFAYANQSLALAKKLNLKKCEVYAYQNIAGYYYYRGNMQLASDNLLKAIAIIMEINDKPSLSDAYNHLSAIVSRAGNYSQALDYNSKALDIAKELNDTTRISTLLCNRGITYMTIADYTSALNYFLDALKICESINRKIDMATCNYNIGKIYWLGYNNSNKAIYYINLSLTESHEANDQFITATALEELGEIYQANKEWDKALSYFQQSLELDKKIGNFPIIISNTRSLAMVYAEKGDFNNATSLGNQAILLSKQIGDTLYGLGNSYFSLGEIYLKKKDYKNAVTWLNKSLDLSKRVNQKNNESNTLLYLANSYEGLHDFESAYHSLLSYKVLRDSIVNDESVSNTAKMEVMYNTGKKEKQIALLTKDREIQKMHITFLKVVAFGGLSILTILFLLTYRYYRTRQLLKVETLRNKLASDLHDEVGSTLSSIAIFSEIARQQAKEVAPLLDQIKESSRKIIESMADIVWTINPENDNFENIIIRMRSFAFELLGSKKINFEFNTDESVINMKLPMEARKNLYLIFKEATNNLAKYAEADRASFSLTASKNNLTMLIKDNGIGFEVDQPSKGNGLKNMRKRAVEMGGKFSIVSKPGEGTTIQLLLKTA